jgi:hypothetical protein
MNLTIPAETDKTKHWGSQSDPLPSDVFLGFVNKTQNRTNFFIDNDGFGNICG